MYVFTIQHEASSKNIQVICKFNVLGKCINSYIFKKAEKKRKSNIKSEYWSFFHLNIFYYQFIYYLCQWNCKWLGREKIHSFVDTNCFSKRAFSAMLWKTGMIDYAHGDWGSHSRLNFFHIGRFNIPPLCKSTLGKVLLLQWQPPNFIEFQWTYVWSGSYCKKPCFGSIKKMRLK